MCKAFVFLCFAISTAINTSTAKCHSPYKFIFPQNGDFLYNFINNTHKDKDMIYLFTGDPQLWSPCDDTNQKCLEIYGNCNNLRNERNKTICQKNQGEYSNRLQKKSIQYLIDFLPNKPKGIIINGDLTAFGHKAELDRFRKFWEGDVRSVPVYPGLGNHDYANNINDCTGNVCAERMTKWLLEQVAQMGLTADAEEIERKLEDEQYSESDWYSLWDTRGSLAYSWNECLVPGHCIHFVQLHNYPYYTQQFDGKSDWAITDSVSWLKEDLGHGNFPVVINFHDFDTKFNESAKLEFKRELKGLGANVLGIFFANVHWKVGFHPEKFWCIRGKTVPLLYSGSVPANRYLVAKFSLSGNGFGLQELYGMQVKGWKETEVENLDLQWLNMPCG